MYISVDGIMHVSVDGIVYISVDVISAARIILLDGENISCDASLVVCMNSTGVPPIMIVNRMCENQKGSSD
jgi:hypothetical protein